MESKVIQSQGTRAKDHAALSHWFISLPAYHNYLGELLEWSLYGWCASLSLSLSDQLLEIADRVEWWEGLLAVTRPMWKGGLGLLKKTLPSGTTSRNMALVETGLPYPTKQAGPLTIFLMNTPHSLPVSYIFKSQIQAQGLLVGRISLLLMFHFQYNCAFLAVLNLTKTVGIFVFSCFLKHFWGTHF